MATEELVINQRTRKVEIVFNDSEYVVPLARPSRVILEALDLEGLGALLAGDNFQLTDHTLSSAGGSINLALRGPGGLYPIGIEFWGYQTGSIDGTGSAKANGCLKLRVVCGGHRPPISIRDLLDKVTSYVEARESYGQFV